MDFKELLDYCKAEAICHTLTASEVSVWRTLCRNYSKKFSTPLHLCLDGTIPPEDILLAEFEDQLETFDEEKDLEQIIEQIYRIEDPDYDDKASEELEEFMQRTAAEEQERVRLGKPIHRLLKRRATKKSLLKRQSLNLQREPGATSTWLILSGKKRISLADSTNNLLRYLL